MGKKLRYHVTHNNIFLGKNKKKDEDIESPRPMETTDRGILEGDKEKKEFDEEEVETLQGFVLEQTNKFYVDHIPMDSIKDLRSTCKTLSE
jgi:hypothetical protein